MEYVVLTPEDRRQMLKDRLRAYEADHYTHTINLKLGLTEAERSRSENDLARLAAAIAVVRTELTPLQPATR